MLGRFVRAVVDKKKTAVYIDGYNPFYGRLCGTALKWLDLPVPLRKIVGHPGSFGCRDGGDVLQRTSIGELRLTWSSLREAQSRAYAHEDENSVDIPRRRAQRRTYGGQGGAEVACWP